MKRKDLELVEHLSELDNTCLEQISINSAQIIKTRKNRLAAAFTSKNTQSAIELSQFFCDKYLPSDVSEILHKLEYDKNDRQFMNNVMNSANFSLDNFDRGRILYQYLACSLKNTDFYHAVKEDFPQEIKDIIKNKFSKNSLKNVNPDIFLELIKRYNLEISVNNFKKYIENDSLPILKIIVESGAFTKILDMNNDKIKEIALLNYQEKSAQFLIETYNLEKKVSFFFSDDTSAENFCKNSKIDFYTYVLDNFDFENNQEYLMYFMHHLGKTNSEEKWKIGIDLLVKKHIDNPDFVEQVKRKIEISKIEDYKEVARVQFQYSLLDASLKVKEGSSKTIKI